ncbi:hypothetical protein [Lysinibacillus fusiformis]
MYAQFKECKRQIVGYHKFAFLNFKSLMVNA